MIQTIALTQRRVFRALPTLERQTPDQQVVRELARSAAPNYIFVCDHVLLIILNTNVRDLERHFALQVERKQLLEDFRNLWIYHLIFLNHVIIDTTCGGKVGLEFAVAAHNFLPLQSTNYLILQTRPRKEYHGIKRPRSVSLLHEASARASKSSMAQLRPRRLGTSTRLRTIRL